MKAPKLQTPMKWISSPVTTLQGEITVQGDKSISHRAIILGSIAKGTTIINGFLESEDCMATLNAMRAMGVYIEDLFDQQVVIHGVGKQGLTKPKEPIDCGNSGTSMRLLAGLLAAQPFDSVLTGDSSLLQRPMERVAMPLTLMGADIQTTQGRPPLRIKGGKTLKAIDYVMSKPSAQVKSCLLFAGLYAQGQTRITETGVSRNHTELMLNAFSYPLHQTNKTLAISSDSEGSGTEVLVPGDISSAAFFIVAATITPGSNVIIRGVGLNPTRSGLIHLLLEMGASITLLNERQYGEEPVADVQIKYAPLAGIRIPEAQVSIAMDEFPILFIAAACAKGETVLHGAQELRVKESDRITGMAQGLSQLGIEVHTFDDGLSIQGGTLLGGAVDSLGDHRIAMAFAIAGAVATGPITINNCAPVATSFPSFLSTANTLEFQIKEVANGA